jgi:hypothetical protein
MQHGNTDDLRWRLKLEKKKPRKWGTEMESPPKSQKVPVPAFELTQRISSHQKRPEAGKRGMIFAPTCTLHRIYIERNREAVNLEGRSSPLMAAVMGHTSTSTSISNEREIVSSTPCKAGVKT